MHMNCEYAEPSEYVCIKVQHTFVLKEVLYVGVCAHTCSQGVCVNTSYVGVCAHTCSQGVCVHTSYVGVCADTCSQGVCVHTIVIKIRLY